MGPGCVQTFLSRLERQERIENRAYKQLLADGPTKRWQILRSNADFKTTHAFSPSLGRKQPLVSDRYWPVSASSQWLLWVGSYR